uniref:Required for meiotic nuclear division protein 1 n=1 Tax=Ascaris suum TaxID=6253 RepID=F1L7W1_ASCSU
MRLNCAIHDVVVSCARQFYSCSTSSRLTTHLSGRLCMLTPFKCVHKCGLLNSLEAVAPLEQQRYRAARKNARKRRPLTAAYDFQPIIGPYVVAIPLAESFDLSTVAKDSRLIEVYQPACVDEESDEGLHFVPKDQYIIDRESVREFFVFADGVVVFWGMENAERAQVLRCLERHVESEYDSRMVQEEIDTMPFALKDEGSTQISSDQLLLNVGKYERGHNSSFSILERYSFSHGMAASVKVAIWESQLSEQAEPLAATTKALSQGVIPWRRKEALKKTGQFSALRHSINLNCNLLNTDFYWEREELEHFYEMALRHFTVPRRLKLLNSRLDYCEDLVKLIDGMLSHRHASTLEWMIIILIIIEVIFEIWTFTDSAPTKVVICEEQPRATDD